MMLCEETAGDVLGERRENDAERSRRAVRARGSRKHGGRSDDV